LFGSLLSRWHFYWWVLHQKK